MVISSFPPVETADEHGLLAIGGDLDVESLLLAYRSGIFPWPMNEEFITWFAPPTRFILFFEELHISRSLKRLLKQHKFALRCNTNFSAVVEKCAESTNREGQDGTWVTEDIRQGYQNLHEAGHAHSVEAYQDGELVGGIYGVHIGKMFAGESMFYRQTGASKVCLCALVGILQSQGCTWLDCQVQTHTLEKFGARELLRTDFMEILQVKVETEPELFFPKGELTEKFELEILK